MPALRVHSYSISTDGFVAGPEQSTDNPLGVGGMALHEWVFPTASFSAAHGGDGGERGTVDDRWVARSDEGVEATLMGRNMFGPVRGPWPAAGPLADWRGWWGEEPPFHHPVVVLTHHEREPLELTGTTFHFVTGGHRAGLALAFELAGGADVRLGGGCETVRQCLADGLVDELHLAVAPVLLGRGERLFDGVDAAAAGYEVSQVEQGERAVHVLLKRAG